MKSENDEVSVLCLNYSSTFKRGKLMLPIPFCDDFGEHISDRVYLHTPSGDIWHGSYEPRSACISGLSKMMDHYSVKAYHAVLLHYTGGPNFKIEIFNQYGVEVNYPVRSIIVNPKRFTRASSSTGSYHLINITPVELDKLRSTLTYSVLNPIRNSHDILITKEHLENISIPLISKNGCSKLGLNECISTLEIGFEKYNWKIRLKWRSGRVFFDNEWLKFVKDAKLCVGDICVIHGTIETGKFQVAILEKRDISNFNKLGLQQGKSLMKFFKIMSNSAVRTLSLELPRLFMKEYGKKLKKKVELLMPDGMVYRVNFSSFYKLVYGLDEVLEAYSIRENYVLFFDYLGASRFYVSVFDTFCMDLSNEFADKLFVKNLEIEGELADIVGVIEIDSTNSMSMDDQDEGNYSYVEDAIDEFADNFANVEDVDEVNLGFEIENPTEDDSFTVILKSSHVDNSGHGAYCPPRIIHIYGSWRNSTIVTLSVVDRSWQVHLHRKKRMCRFGAGWDKFIADNEYSVGQKLQFAYVGYMTFVVNVVP